jgi:hypothetical protein
MSVKGGGVGNLLGGTSCDRSAWRLADGSRDGPRELSRGSRPFANGGGRCATPREVDVQGVMGEGLVTYRAQGWAAISAWSWVVL